MSSTLRISAKGASLGGPIIDQVKPHVQACNAAADAMEAAGIGDDPNKGHAAALRRVAAHMAAEAVSGRVPRVFHDTDYLPHATVTAGAGGTSGGEITLQAMRSQDARFHKQCIRAGIDGPLHYVLVDQKLEAAGITGRDAIEVKLKLQRAGILQR